MYSYRLVPSSGHARAPPEPRIYHWPQTEPYISHNWPQTGQNSATLMADYFVHYVNNVQYKLPPRVALSWRINFNTLKKLWIIFIPAYFYVNYCTRHSPLFISYIYSSKQTTTLWFFQITVFIIFYNFTTNKTVQRLYLQQVI